MGTFIELYRKSDRNKAEALAFDVLVNDLLEKNKVGNDKIREIGGMDMERSSPTNFIPSMFYIFMYVKQEKEEAFGNSFYDMCPMILCTGADQRTVTGINFNFLPNDVRAVLLDILTDSYKEFYDNVGNDGNELKVNEDLGVALMKGISGVFQYIKSRTNIDISSCVRTYSRSNMLKTRMIEYDQWKYIPFLSFKDAVRGVNLAKLQAEFIANQYRPQINKATQKN